MDRPASYTVPESLAVSDSGFLFLASTGETFTLNQIGKDIFSQLKSGAPVDTIKRQILTEYEVDGATIERDIDDFITQLVYLRLVAPL